MESQAFDLVDPEVCAPPLLDSTPLLKTSRSPSLDSEPSVVLVEPANLTITSEDHFPVEPLPLEPAVEGEPAWEVLEPGDRTLSVESAIERVLLLVLEPAIGGLPGVQSAESRASELMARTHGDVEQAVRQVGEEETSFHRKQMVIEFLLTQSILPFFLGLPFSLILNTFNNIRAIAVVARLYGHSLNSPRTRHEILLCLLPTGPTTLTTTSTTTATTTSGSSDEVKETARTVARSLAGPLLGRATGISMAGDILSLGSDLVGTSGEFSVVSVTPAMTARHYFCPEVTSVWLRAEVAAMVLGMLLPTLVQGNLKLYFGLLNVGILALAVADKLQVSRARISGAGVLLFFAVWAVLPLFNFISSFILIARAVAPDGVATDGATDDGVGAGGMVMTRISLVALGMLNLFSNLTRQYRPGKYETLCSNARIGLLVLVLPQLWLAQGGEGGGMGFSLWYVAGLVSSFSQQRFVETLKRREVFLKLLGAERVMTLSLTLVLKGMTRNITEELRRFLDAMTPSPAVVCALHSVRLHALEMAVLLGAVPKVCEVLLPGKANFYLGLVGGGAVLGLMIKEWHERDYITGNRVFLIMPGEIDAKVKELLTNTGSRAARMVFMSMIKAMFSSIVRKFSSVS